MKQLSNAKRLTLGLGVIVVGICGALPFHQSPPREMAAAQLTTETHIGLGEDVSLQLPGQKAPAEYLPQTLRPWPVDDDVAPVTKPTTVAANRDRPSVPPALPDRYRPLFQPDADSPPGDRHVVQSTPKSPKPGVRLKKHTIHDGDTLESLAVRYLGDPRRAADILDANRQVLLDPQLLPIGIEIVIPRTDRKSGDSAVVHDRPKLVPLPTEGFRRGR